MVIENKFKMWDSVYLITDVDQKKRLVTAILIRGAGLMYELSCGSSTSWHHQNEISIEQDILISSTN
jgi:hypothetical protein